MSQKARILVAAEMVEDAGLVKKLLSDEFEQVFISTHPERSVHDFETHRPDVLILAFKTLEQSERYYLGLYRLSKLVHATPHRTLILCDKNDLQRVYALCKKEYFDDYILFWPMTHDAPRLPMAVYHAVRHMALLAADGPSAAEFATQARRMAELETLLDKSLARGRETVVAANRSLEQAELNIEAALDSFSHGLAHDQSGLVEVKNPGGLASEFHRLKADHIQKQFRSAAAAVQPVDQWIGSVNKDLAPQIESARALRTLAARIRPRVLVIDDDLYQHKLVDTLLGDANLELSFATSGTEALATLRKGRPDLILMDFNLPDIDGVETTRRLKTAPSSATIPVIMITGQSGKEVVVDSLKAGASDFLVKPFDKAALQAKIRKFLT